MSKYDPDSPKKHMRLMYFYSLLTAMLVGGAMGNAQGTFQNLDFEQASIIPIVGSPNPYAITVADALPYWTVSYGTVQQTQIYYNVQSLGGTLVSLYASGYPSAFGGSLPIIDGNFSVSLDFGAVNGVRTAPSISQVGQIPAGTQSLFFDATGLPSGSEVLIGNDSLTLFPVGTGNGNGTGYTIYGANISAWAGQTEQLTFTSGGYWEIDDISFSPGAVPEPSTLELTGIGGVLFALYRRFAPKRQ
jgi:hypothetical protein